MTSTNATPEERLEAAREEGRRVLRDNPKRAAIYARLSKDRHKGKQGEGLSAERQVDVYRHTGDLRAVVQSLVEETRESVEQSARTYKV